MKILIFSLLLKIWRGIIGRRRFLRLALEAELRRTRPAPVGYRPLAVESGGIGITYVGHATVLIQAGSLNILTDPNYARRVILAKRLVRPGIPFEELPPIDVVLLSHAHFDHLDRATLKRLPRSAHVILPRGTEDLAAPLGFSQVTAMDWGESARVKGAVFTARPVRHWGTRLFDDDHRGYCSYTIATPGGTVYFAGDTGYFEGFAEIGRTERPIVALLPIAAYHPPSYRRMHLNPEDALKAWRELGARYLVPIHWGTFILSYEPPDEPRAWLERLVREQGLEERVVILEHGQGRVFSG